MLNSTTYRAGIADELKLYVEYNDNVEVNPVILWDAAKDFLRDLQTQFRDLERIHISTEDQSALL